MKINETVTIIVTTYNNPSFLNTCIRSIFKQTILPYEIIIADDGSTDETCQLIHKLKKESPVKLVHIWQPDNGFQAAKIRNLAIAASSTEYIIQIDGDIILEKHFIEDHLYHRSKGCILQGSRIYLSEALTASIVNRNSEPGVFNKGMTNWYKGIRSRVLSNLIRRINMGKEFDLKARGCNLSFYKNDFIQVNGYNHDFCGWGHEDSELVLRMLNNGVCKKHIKFNCIQYHMFHIENNRDSEKVNKERMKIQRELNSTFCQHGINEIISIYQDYIRD